MTPKMLYSTPPKIPHALNNRLFEALFNRSSNHLEPNSNQSLLTPTWPLIHHSHTHTSTNPPLTPLTPILPPPLQQSYSDDCPMPTWHHQQPLYNEHSNEPWGNCWALQQPTNLFCVISKNIGTINLCNLDILAVTKELMLLSASVFTAQETNAHWGDQLPPLHPVPKHSHTILIRYIHEHRKGLWLV